jgi:3-methyl-2-oxobutanoate hydroxymethyltransferase
LGLNPDFKPKFVKRFADLYQDVHRAAGAFFEEVREGRFPDEEHSFSQKALRLVASNPEPEPANTTERDEKAGPIFGVPV